MATGGYGDLIARKIPGNRTRKSVIDLEGLRFYLPAQLRHLRRCRPPRIIMNRIDSKFRALRAARIKKGSLHTLVRAIRT